ncbi:MAG TPA: hypothetical protein VLI65_00615 [Pyrinomonadaceae bacterium]|jgi:hypothetical protein|nr:hypothetical protein [Pyrinomonadaceae bacterium]
MSGTERQFVLCIRNDGCDDLEVRKIYEVLPDESAAADEYIRIIDESGEDYLYPASYFYPVEITQSVRETLLHAA